MYFSVDRNMCSSVKVFCVFVVGNVRFQTVLSMIVLLF